MKVAVGKICGAVGLVLVIIVGVQLAMGRLGLLDAGLRVGATAGVMIALTTVVGRMLESSPNAPAERDGGASEHP